MSWFVFALAAQIFYTVSAFIDRFLIEKRVKDAISLSVIGGTISFIVGFVILIIRNFPSFPIEQIILVIIAGALFEISLFPYYKAIAIDDPSRVVPLYQTIPIFVLVLSFVFLGESLSITQLGGFALVLFGGFILSMKKPSLGVFKLRKSFWFMMAATATIAVGLILFKFVVDIQGVWDSLGYEYLGAGLGAFILYFSPFRQMNFLEAVKGIKRSTVAIISANETLWVLGRFATFFSSSLAPVSLIAVIGGVQPILMFLGGLLISIWLPNIVKEDLSGSAIKTKIIAIILAFLGIWLINK